MAENKNDQVVVAFFADMAAAESAVETLRFWDTASDHVELGTVGTLVATPDGEIKVNVGRKGGKGAKVGAIMGVIAGVFTGGVGLIGGLIGGAVAGGGIGAFFKQSTNLTKDEIDKIGEELRGGKVAVVVTCDDHELPTAKRQLTLSGGTVWTYEVSAEAMATAAAVVEAPEDKES